MLLLVFQIYMYVTRYCSLYIYIYEHTHILFIKTMIQVILYYLYFSPDVVDRARNRMRIRIANIMMGLTLVACLFMAISGKRAQERGESITLQTIERHKQLREEGEREKKEGTAQ